VTTFEFDFVATMWPRRTRLRSASVESMDAKVRVLMTLPKGPDVVA
jgi:hypothetical protein